MATYNVNRAKHAALTAATVDTVNFAYTGSVVRVANRHASSYISFTIDGTTPTFDGNDTYTVGPGQSVTVNQSRVSQVKLISDGTPTYDCELY